MSVAPYETWTRADKDFVGCALDNPRLWFTIAGGLVTEVFYPRVDFPQIKMLNFFVTDEQDFWIDLSSQDCSRVEETKPGVPAFVLHHEHKKFHLTLRVCPEPHRDALLVAYRLEGNANLKPFIELTPRLGEVATDQEGQVLTRAAFQALTAERAPYGLALVAGAGGADAILRTHVSLFGHDDLLSQFSQDRRLVKTSASAGPGVVTLAAELAREGTIVLAFSSSASAAATLARAAVTVPFESSWQRTLDDWTRWLAGVVHPNACAPEDKAMLSRSAAVLKTHKCKSFPGALVASLATPWGSSSSSFGGYHLVWPRDLCETATALLGLGLVEESREVLSYLIASQQDDGHWFQNQWLGGRPYWQGVQLDETAFPVLLASALHERNALHGLSVQPMIRAALSYLVHHGPVSDEDRWEEDAGINSFSLAVMIAALIVGAEFLDKDDAALALRVADEWNSLIEDWCVTKDTALDRQYGLPGHYVRVAPRDILTSEQALNQRVLIHNRSDNLAPEANEQIALDFLQLVRYGIRRPDDAYIKATVFLADRLLRTDTPSGPVWHRYNGDGYGEHADGAPFDGTGIGRGWPLLCGERGHYALISGEDPHPYLRAMVRMTGRGGLLPEQVWDSDPIPERRLFPGRPSGSAMPLVWAHAEYIKLHLSLAMGGIFDRPAAVSRHCDGKRPLRRTVSWSLGCPIQKVPAGLPFSILLPRPAIVHYGRYGWNDIRDLPTTPCGLGMHEAILPTQSDQPGTPYAFTVRWSDGTWLGRDYSVTITEDSHHGF
jgi:glucoamylase